MSGNETKWIWTNNPGADIGGDKTNPPIRGFDDEPTRRVEEPAGTVSDMLAQDETTHHIGSAAGEGDIDEPVTGWLVVVKGPGRGSALTMGSGLSTVGRGTDQRLSLPFGDNSVSRSHARMIYDPNDRKFFIMPGDGKNLTRVNGELLLANRELTGGELIELGDTHLRFVPFCGEHFDWSDAGDSADADT